MILFETDKKPLTFLLDKIENRDLALPDFQRSFVWDPNATRELVVSIIRSFPAGTLLQLEGGSSLFAPRAFEEAPSLNGKPTHLILDGQQRMTSLYQAFSGRGAHRFFLNVRELLDGADADEAVEVYPAKRARRWASRDAQASDLMLPLAEIREFSEWSDDVIDLLEDEGIDERKLRKQLNEIERTYVDPIKLYNFPVTTLSSATPVEAVCTIFETLNRTGVKLSVFELLSARAFAHEVRLRDMWASAQQDLPVLQDFSIDPYYVLQVVAMNVRKSPKRSSVLALEVDEIVEHWDEAVRGLAESLTMLRDECGVLVQKWLPYQPVLVTMASAWRVVSSATGPAQGARRTKLKQWFWCASFAQRYENSVSSMTERDVPDLISWLEGGEAPPVVESFRFNSTRWREVTGRQRALYRATIALLMRRSPLDFHTSVPLSKPVIDSSGVDDHHVFPRNFLARTGRGDAVDSVLNHTLIDRKTNIRIGAHAPSDYLAEMRSELGDVLGAVLASHGLPSDENGPLLQDDFEDFLDWRLHHLERELAEVTQGEVGEAVAPMELELHAGPADGPGDVPALPWREQPDIVQLIEDFDTGESGALIEAFLDEVDSWPGVTSWAGKGERLDWRLVHVSRHGSPFGAFCKVHPRFKRVTFRLSPEDGPPSDLALALERKGPYTRRVLFESSRHLGVAIELARAAYDRATY